MNDRETRVLINTEQRCVESSLQWRWTDGKQAHEVVGREKENWIWHGNFKPPGEIVPELQFSEDREVLPYPTFSGFSAHAALPLCLVPTRQMIFHFHRRKHSHTPTTPPPFYNRKISYPRAMNGSVIASQPSTAVQQKVLDIILELM